MTWFRVDDRLAMHPKMAAAGNAAVGLWVRAGAWCSQQDTGGVVPVWIVRSLGSVAQAHKLTKVGLWDRVDEGWRFHDWSDYQPDAEDVRKARKASASLGNHRRWHVSRGIKKEGCEWCS